MRFVVLGPVAVVAAGQHHSLARAQTRGLLALLLLNPGRALSREAITDALWGGAAPTSARAQMHNTIRYIRGRLAELGQPTMIETGPFGYRINVDPGLVDAAAFDQYVQRSRVAAAKDDHAEAVRLLRAGLDLWSGEPLLDAAGAFVESARARLTDGRLTAVEDLADLELRHGRPDLVATELAPLVGAHPLRERLRMRLMLALYHSGRQADALRTCREYRLRLAEQEGLDPGNEIAELERLIVRADPSLDAPASPVPASPVPASPVPASPAPGSGPTAGATGLPVPAQLPPDVGAFTGRTGYLRRLDALLPPDTAASAAAAVVISAVAGGGGVGKTALAVHWGHRVRGRFPDGQLYVNLRGYSTDAPLQPIEALTQFLRALGVAAAQVPPDVAEAAGLYRSLLADRRLLVLLDNARTADQVRPLLPGSATCMVLITSRDSLTGLVAHDGAHQFALDVLSPDEAAALLVRILGPDRVGAEPVAAAELARLCAHLPLALRIAGAKLAVDPLRRIGDLVTDLSAGNRIAALAVEGDERAAVQVTFDLSYQGLPPRARRLFRLLGLVPGPDVTVPAAAVLTGTMDETVAAGLLGALAAAHLVDQHAPGRYAFHDLLRLYARDLADQEEDEPARTRAMGRLFGFYLSTVDRAAKLLAPQILRLPADSADPDPAPLVEFDAAGPASAWLDAERANLVAAVRHAAERGPRRFACLLADGLRGYFLLRMCMVEWETAAEAGLTAAQAEEDPAAEAAAHISLAGMHWRRGAYEQSTALYLTALDLTRQAGWLSGQAATLNNLASVHHVLGRPAQAVEMYAQALAINRAAGDSGGEAIQLGNLGAILAELGRLDESLDHLHQGLIWYRRSGARVGEAWALSTLGELHYLLGHRDVAQEHLDSALTILRELGDRGMEAVALRALAVLRNDAGDYAEALDLGQAALSLARTVDHRRGEANALFTLGEIHSRLGEHRQAIAHCEEAVRLSADTGGHLEAEAITGLAAAQHRAGVADHARGTALRALGAARQAGYQLIEGCALTVIAGVDLAAGKLDDALRCADEAAKLHEQTGYPLGLARALVVRGAIALRSDDRDTATDHWRRAAELFSAIGAAEADEVRVLLAR